MSITGNSVVEGGVNEFVVNLDNPLGLEESANRSIKLSLLAGAQNSAESRDYSGTMRVSWDGISDPRGYILVDAKNTFTLDAGKTWTRMGLEKTRNIHRIIIDSKNPDNLYVAAIGSPWGDHPDRGVFKSTDGGQTWNKILFVNERTGPAEMVMDPSDRKSTRLNSSHRT